MILKPNLINNKVLFENNSYDEYVPTGTSYANFKFDDNILDSSINNWVGTTFEPTGVIIPTYENGVKGKALYIREGTYLSLRGDYTSTLKDLYFRNLNRVNKNNFSVSFWFNIKSITDDHCSLLGFNTAFNGDGSYWIQYIQQTVPFLFFSLVEGININNIVYFEETLKLNNWYFLVAQYNNTTGIQSLYLDCVLKHSKDIGIDLVTAYNSGDLFAGRNGSLPGLSDDFLIDDLWMINEVWTEQQMIEYYNIMKYNRIIGTE